MHVMLLFLESDATVVALFGPLQRENHTHTNRQITPLLLCESKPKTSKPQLITSKKSVDAVGDEVSF